MKLITIQSLEKKYGNNVAVKEINFSFDHGKCIALLGPNGAGKTTILRMLAGLMKPTKGKITFSGQKSNTDIRQFIGYLPQYPIFPLWMTAKEFLVYSGELAFLTKQKAKSRAEELSRRVGISELLDMRIGSFSGGMKQRLGIAQAMIHSPKLLILDEPVSSLDPIGRREVMTLLEELKQDMTILFSTHILNDAEEISDELLLLKDGRIVESGSIADLRKKYQTAVIELTFEENTPMFLDQIKALTAVSDCYVEKEKLKVITPDIAKVRAELLHVAANESWPLTHFYVSEASLEEMFLKVVGE